MVKTTFEGDMINGCHKKKNEDDEEIRIVMVIIVMVVVTKGMIKNKKREIICDVRNDDEGPRYDNDSRGGG